MTVQGIIDNVRPQLYPYLGRVRLTDAVLLRHILAVDKEVYALIQQIAPNMQLDTVSDDINVVDDVVVLGNDRYYSLSAEVTGMWTVGNIMYKRADNGKTYKVTIRPSTDEAVYSGDGPEAWVEYDGTLIFLHPIDPWGDDWNTTNGAVSERQWWGDSNDVFYFRAASPNSNEALSGVLDSPIFAQPYIESAVIVRALLPDNGVPEAVLQRAVNTMQKNESIMLLNMYDLARVESTMGSKNSRSEDSYGAFHARLF